MADKGDGGKKARQFDIMAMFEEARQTAVERTQLASGSSTVTNEEAENVVARLNKQTISKPRDSSESSSDSDSEDSDDEGMIGPPLPPSLKSSEADDDLIGPPLPPSLKSSKLKEDQEIIGPPVPRKHNDDGDDDDDGSDEEDDSPISKIPSSLQITLEHGSKTVSGLAFDPSGARLVTAGYDYDVKLYDFAGMDSTLKAFRTLRPCESHTIRHVEYSTTGDMILIVAGNCQAKMLDRDGHVKFECHKGDPYLTDMAQTKGHTAMLNAGCFNPKVKTEFLTCSNDGTVRLWDVNAEGKKHKNVLKPRSQQGRKVVPTACTYSCDGRWVVAACQDGSIQIWDHTRSFVNIAMTMRTAHMSGSDTSSLCFSYDGRVLASRGGDDTVKLFDIRNFKQPLKVRNNLDNFFPVTDVLFSPDDRLVVTGISVKKNQGMGKLLFMDRESLDTLTELEVSDTSVVRCVWHPKLNQFVVGCGNGQAKLYYDEKKSHRGAKLCVSKMPSKVKQMEIVSTRRIITPYALKAFRDGSNFEMSTKKREQIDRKDPVKSHRPDLPMYGPGEGGRLANKGGTLSRYVMQQMVVQKEDPYENNPREAILRHAKAAAEKPLYIAPAYNKTQPVQIFQEEKKEKVDDDIQPPWKKIKKS